MESTNSRKVIHHNPHFFVWVTLIVVLIATGGCGTATPQTPIVKTINIESQLDIHEINTNFQSGLQDFVFFLGGPTTSYHFTFTVSSWANSENTLKVLSGGGQEHFSVNSDGHYTTPEITGNVVIFRYQVDCSDCVVLPPQVKLDSAQLTLSTTPVFPSVEAGLADTLSSMPVNLDYPIYMLIDNSEITTYFLSAGVVANTKAFAGLDGSNKVIISEPALGFLLGEDQAIDVMNNNSSLNPKLLTPGPGLTTLLFTIPVLPGLGIAKFSISSPETQLLDFAKVVAAGGGFYTVERSTLGCTVGMYDALTGPPGEGITKGEPGIIFGAKCKTNVRRIDGNLFAYLNFELQNGWVVKSVGRQFTTRGTWFISEQEAADESGRGNGQGFNLDEAPAAGSTTPFLKGHISAERAPAGDERTYWVYVSVEIEGPHGTDPYGSSSSCPQGYMEVRTTEGAIVCTENLFISSDGFFGKVNFYCSDSRDCDGGYACVNIIPGEQGVCVSR